MNAIIEIINDSSANWVPDQQLCENWIHCTLQAVTLEGGHNISIRFVESQESCELNGHYRGNRSATNVLSFPASFPTAFSKQIEHIPLGDIVICPEVLEKEAATQDKTLQAHWAHLTIHGLLHLLGYDHESEESAEIMEGLEISTLESLGFPNPYLIV